MIDRAAWRQASQAVRISLRTVEAELQPVLVYARQRQPIHPVAALKRRNKLSGSFASNYNGYGGSGTRYYTTKHSIGKGPSYGDRSRFTNSTRVGGALHRSSGRTAFASTLRPNLTGGTLNRTSGGYAFGAGSAGRSARYFSNSPAAPAQVVHSVSQAVRAFVVSGQKAHFDGMDTRTGEKRFRAVSALQEETSRKMMALPKTALGSYAELNINPTVTGLSHLGSVGDHPSFAVQQTLCSDGLLDVLSVDFSRSLKELAVVLNDLKKLSALGDLPITYQKTTIRVHFPGCDSTSVESLCTELGVQRAIVRQDDGFVEIDATTRIPNAADADAGIDLLFPLAPNAFGKVPGPGNDSIDAADNADEGMIFTQDVQRDQIEWHDMVGPVPTTTKRLSGQMETPVAVSSAMTVTGSMLDDANNTDADIDDVDNHRNRYLSSPSGYDTLHSSELDDTPLMPPPGRQHDLNGAALACSQPEGDTHANSRLVADYEGFEGIYRFIEQCDSAVRR